MKNDTLDHFQKKNFVLKLLAIAGFLAIVIIIAWGSVQLVNNSSGVFSSLAQMAQNVQQYGQSSQATSTAGEAVVVSSNNPLIVTSSKKAITTGEELFITWTTAKVPGTYVFHYECADGLAIDVRDEDGIRSISCDTNYNVGNVSNLSLLVDSEKQRFLDVTYSISFLGANDVTPATYDDAVFTVINNSVSLDLAQNTNIDTEYDFSGPNAENPDIVVATSTIEDSTLDQADQTSIATSTETQADVSQDEVSSTTLALEASTPEFTTVSDFLASQSTSTSGTIAATSTTTVSTVTSVVEPTTAIATADENDTGLNQTNIQNSNTEVSSVVDEEPESVSPKFSNTPAVTTDTMAEFDQPDSASLVFASIPTVDMVTRFLNVGTFVNNRLVISPIQKGSYGSFQFAVENRGTIASGFWTYTVRLPNGQLYISELQRPLQAQERSIITFGFPAGNTDSHTFIVNVNANTDVNTNNNTFVQPVTFVE